MLSIYQDVDSIIHNFRDYFTESDRVFNPKKMDLAFLQLTKLFLANAKEMTSNIQKGRLTKLDPIVGDNACQKRALATIQGYLDAKVKEEAQQINQKADVLLKTLNQHINNHKLPGMRFDCHLDTLLENLGLILKVSEKMAYLLRAHLLTAGKVFVTTRSGEETSYIDCEVLKQRFAQQLERSFIEKIVLLAKERIADHSIALIQEEAAKVSDKLAAAQLQNHRIKQIEVPVKKDTSLQLKCSCAFYNFKTILLRLMEQRIPFLIKEYRTDKQRPIGFYFRSSEPGTLPVLMQEKLESKQPVFVLECFFPEGMQREEIYKAIQKHGLFEIALANAAVVPQYSNRDDFTDLDSQAQEEIAHYRELGKKFGCQTSNPLVFSIAHTHAATIHEENVVV